MAVPIMAAVDVDVSMTMAVATAAVAMVVDTAVLSIPMSIQLWPGEKMGRSNQ